MKGLKKLFLGDGVRLRTAREFSAYCDALRPLHLQALLDLHRRVAAMTPAEARREARASSDRMLTEMRSGMYTARR